MASSYTDFTVHTIESEDEARTLEDELEDQRGIQLVEIDHESGHVEARYTEELLSEERIKSRVRDSGYELQ